MYGMLRADCTDSQTVLRTTSPLTSLCRARRGGGAGPLEHCDSRLLNALQRQASNVKNLWNPSARTCVYPDSGKWKLRNLHARSDLPALRGT